MKKDDLRTDDTSSKQIILSDTDDDDFQPKKKRLRADDALTSMQQDISEIKDNIVEIMSLSISSHIPIALRHIIRDSFRCKICLCVPMKPPVIVSKCCKTLLGCDSCVNKWFCGEDALTKSCPACRAVRGYNETMLLHGIDDFLKEIGKAIVTDKDSDNEELPQLNLD